MATAVQVVIDCRDPAKLAPFWAALLGYKEQDPPDGFESWQDWLKANHVPEDQWNAASAVIDPDGRGPRIFFQRVPEPKTVKNRVHLDINVGADMPHEGRRARVDQEVERVIGLGATKIRAMEQRGEYWVVMADPEGNEFCLQ